MGPLPWWVASNDSVHGVTSLELATRLVYAHTHTPKRERERESMPGPNGIVEWQEFNLATISISVTGG